MENANPRIGCRGRWVDSIDGQIAEMFSPEIRIECSYCLTKDLGYNPKINFLLNNGCELCYGRGHVLTTLQGYLKAIILAFEEDRDRSSPR